MRFNRLSTLRSSSILGTVILYSPAAVSSDPAPIVDPFSDPEHATSGSESEPQGAMRSANAPHLELVAAAHVLPLVISALGIGITRFLKGIIPVIVGRLALPISNLTAGPSERDGKPSQSQVSVNGPFTLHLASLHVVNALIDTCPLRITRWATTINDGLAKCWVGCADVVFTSTVLPQLGVLRGRM
ncbi:hypothetical protein EDC04DRAFT_1478195 [Pisolithus marmoratus]|nr:hypothetical protein EDC04DRAFT_1478195 [Pisolithus marmoratus]